jgi:hypothetical protein
VGVNAGGRSGNITSGTLNVCIGPNSGGSLVSGTTNVFIGSFASTNGDKNICIGDRAGFGSTGDKNIFIGSDRTGSGFQGLTSGDQNLCMGSVVGSGAGNNCVFIGEYAYLGNGVATVADAVQAYGIGYDVIIGPDTGSSAANIKNAFAFGGNIYMDVLALPSTTELSNVTAVGTNLTINGHNRMSVFGHNSNISNRNNQVVLANGGNVLSLAANGDITITGVNAFKPGGGSWTATSDRRLKHDITLANSLVCENLVRSLPLKRFTWDEIVTTGGDKSQLGFVAQDVEQFMPKSVVTRDMFGLEDCKLLDVSQVNFAMYGALQRCIQRIDDLEKTVASLTGSLAPSSGT